MLKLIYRDLFIYQKRNLFILPGFAFFFVIYSGGMGSAGFSLVLILISLFALTMTAQTAFSYDDLSKFNRFLRATPVPPSTIVLSRYAACLFSSIMGVAYVVLFAVLANTASVRYPALQRDMKMDVAALFILIMAVSIYSAVLMPILFKFGYMKTKYPLMLLFIALAAGAPTILSSTGINQRLLAALSSINVTSGCTILLVVSLLVMYGSIYLAIAVFKRKEE